MLFRYAGSQYRASKSKVRACICECSDVKGRAAAQIVLGILIRTFVSAVLGAAHWRRQRDCNFIRFAVCGSIVNDDDSLQEFLSRTQTQVEVILGVISLMQRAYLRDCHFPYSPHSRFSNLIRNAI
jgi:hypothetical protein